MSVVGENAPLLFLGGSSGDEEDDVAQKGEGMGAGKVAMPEVVTVEDWPVTVRPAYRKNGRSFGSRWIVSQRLTHGAVCYKPRSVLVDKSLFGALGVRLHMGAWIAATEMDEGDHKVYEPSVGEMQQYVRDRGLL